MTVTSGTGTVYALIDPRDGAIRYIGSTARPLVQRLGGHLMSPPNPAVAAWIEELAADELTPSIKAIERGVPVGGLVDAEGDAILDYFHAGHPILNCSLLPEEYQIVRRSLIKRHDGDSALVTRALADARASYAQPPNPFLTDPTTLTDEEAEGIGLAMEHSARLFTPRRRVAS